MTSSDSLLQALRTQREHLIRVNKSLQLQNKTLRQGQQDCDKQILSMQSENRRLRFRCEVLAQQLELQAVRQRKRHQQKSYQFQEQLANVKRELRMKQDQLSSCQHIVSLLKLYPSSNLNNQSDIYQIINQNQQLQSDLAACKSELQQLQQQLLKLQSGEKEEESVLDNLQQVLAEAKLQIQSLKARLVQYQQHEQRILS